MRLKKYKWIGPAHWARFSRGSVVIDLFQVTDVIVERLLKEDPEYWSQKFEKASPPKKKEKEVDPEAGDK